jgi:hypothetical protein
VHSSTRKGSKTNIISVDNPVSTEIQLDTIAKYQALGSSRTFQNVVMTSHLDILPRDFSQNLLSTQLQHSFNSCDVSLAGNNNWITETLSLDSPLFKSVTDQTWATMPTAEVETDLVFLK